MIAEFAKLRATCPLVQKIACIWAENCHFSQQLTTNAAISCS